MIKTKMFNVFAIVLVVLGFGAASMAHAQDTVIRIGDEAGAIGAAIDLPVHLDANNHNAAGLDIHIEFDESELELRGGGSVGPCGFVDPGPALSSGQTMICNDEGGGRLFVGIDAPVTFPIPTIDEGIMFFVRFTVANTATVSAVTPVTHDPATVLVANDTGGNVDSANLTVEDGSVEVLDIAPGLSVDPTSLSFTTQSGTTSSAQTVQACNNGNADGLIFNSIGISGVDATNFSQSNNCPGGSPGLAEGACCQVDVTFSPDTIRADYVASLDFDTNANNESVALSGEGTAGPPGDITITPASHAFGELLTGAESEEFTFTVTNDTGGSGSAVEVDTVSIAGDTTQFSITDDSCTGTLASGASCTVTIEFAPTADGDYSVTLTVSGEDGNGDVQSDTAEATGSGVSEARFSSDPPPGTVNLGTAQGGATLNRNVVISNEGNETLTVDGCVISDPDNAFTFSPDPVTFSIAPNESDTLAVSCEVPELGSVSASLTCDTNDPNNASVSYTFTCNSRPLVVPTMQPWGLILLSLMMLAIGGFSIRFFRAS